MKEQYDAVIVGTGAAGLYGALRLANKNASVLVISKREATLSNSSLAQGGIAAVLDTVNDSYELHIKDTMTAGKNINDPDAVYTLVTQGPDEVRELDRLGMDLDRAPDGTPAKTLEAGHSRHRIVHHKDSTGQELVNTLLRVVSKHENIDMCENTMVYGIDKAENGFSLYLLQNGEKTRVLCRYCMLCTGGIGRVYEYTTNSAIATGDGIALAYEMGARIKNLSFVQFHPTAFAAEESRERFLISEAVRGEGAYLLNSNGERFAHNYDERGELAPRDVVSNSILLESQKQKSEKFYLDITHKDADFIKRRFPLIYSRCLEEGVDITKDRIPVYPCQHYLMGGIDIDLDGRTSIDGLYAAGECSHSGAHGANRLASNSLLEALVFSARAADDIYNRLSEQGELVVKPLSDIPAGGKNDLEKGVRTQIRKIMQDTCFVLPKPEKYKESYEQTKKILDNLGTGDYKITTDYVEAKSLATVAYIILKEKSEATKC